MNQSQHKCQYRHLVFFFFVVVTNHQINLCIKICPPLVGMYRCNCLQQKRPNQNLLFRHISRERGPIHPFLCDVKSSFDLFIKPTLNSALSQKGFIVMIVLNKNGPIKIHYRRVYSRGRGPTHLYLCDVKQTSFRRLFSFNGCHMFDFKTLICRFQKKTNVFQAVNRNNNFQVVLDS